MAPIILIFFAIFFVKPTNEECNCQNLSGKWINNKGSVMEISVEGNLISGVYFSELGTDGVGYPLTGWFDAVENERKLDIGGKEQKMHNYEGIIGFTVHYSTYGSICSWSGYCTEIEGVPTIETQWLLSKPYTFQSYEHIVSGNSYFVPLKD